ncbi:MAG TPA: ABC transporter permease subunit [Flexivirga sp.]|uniref:ABC transporter permease subunit n=1 Tax=Flexivirga sp. TaxID=1962927 RepID=UPI002BF13DC5|nr:ABC transporter permease subunit [Flexivirga sp.]HWC23300.1 ABC transporter permease subunit [Flexivirga sp.]
MSSRTFDVIRPAELRPVTWRRLVWVSWRRHRGTLLAAAAVVGAIGIYLIVTGIQLRSAYHQAAGCTPQSSQACRFAWQTFHDNHSNVAMLSVVYVVLPLLLGAFAGAPIIGRELESGTFRFVWTQGVGRMRWAIAMICAGAISTALITGVFGLLVTWHDTPLWWADTVPHLQAGEFSATGIAVIAWALLAYAAALLAGLVFRKVVPAIGTAFAVTFGLAFVASQLRQHYLPPLKTRSLDHVNGTMQLSQWWQQGDTRVSQESVDKVLHAAGIGAGAQPGEPDPTSYLLHHGYTQWTSYQPGSRFWAFQWVEFGWLMVLVVVLVGATFVLLRRRDA